MVLKSSYLYLMFSMYYRAFCLYWSNRSIRAWIVLFRHLFRKLLGQSIPSILFVAPTFRCQCHCVHCSAELPGRKNNRELDTNQFKSIFDQAKRLGVFMVIFTGGDPLLREDLPDMIHHAHTIGLITRIDTNGLLLDREHVSELKRAGVSEVGVSIDDVDPEIHDRLRGVQGIYQKAIQGIHTLREFNIPCQIFSYASKKNVPSGLEKIIDMAKGLPVMGVHITLAMAVGRWDGAADQVLNEEEKEKVRQLKGPPLIHVLCLPSSRSLCPISTKKSLFITSSGDVTPCCVIPYAIGNVTDNTLEEVWDRHCKNLDFKYRGECPVNELRGREALRKHAQTVTGNM